jgi:hypothetical protein
MQAATAIQRATALISTDGIQTLETKAVQLANAPATTPAAQRAILVGLRSVVAQTLAALASNQQTANDDQIRAVIRRTGGRPQRGLVQRTTPVGGITIDPRRGHCHRPPSGGIATPHTRGRRYRRNVLNVFGACELGGGT